MIKTKKQMFIIIGAFALVLLLGSVSYAWFSYRAETGSSEIVAGDIYLTMTEGNETLTLTNIFPETKEEARARNDNYITFELSGLNTSNKTIYYEILLNHGADKPSPKSRYADSDLRFDLVELDNNGDEVTYVVDAGSYDSLIDKRIWVDTIAASTPSEVSKKYKLRAWLSEDVIISDSEPNANYNTIEYPNKYATIKVKVNGDFVEKDLPSAYSIIKKSVDTTTTINFANISSSSNGEGVYVLPGTTNDLYPIYYYRGAVNNNNVIFGGFCWQMVRTTDTGGIKMIYNGVATSNGTTCENSNHVDRIIGESIFNPARNTGDAGVALSDVGYMYNKVYNGYYDNSTVIFGKAIEWNGTKYTLIEDTPGVESTNDVLDEYHHYGCDDGSAQCSSVRYYYYKDSYDLVYLYLTNGETIEDALYKMTGNGSDTVKQRNSNYNLNETDSTMKTYIENWFKTNLTNELDQTKTNFQDYIEDTEYCNDRTFGDSSFDRYEVTLWNPNGGDSTILYFAAKDRRSITTNPWYSTTNVPILTCPNETDRFKLSNPKAQLDYPVGLLTSDEVILAGENGNEYALGGAYYGSNYSIVPSVNTSYYLYTGGEYWTMTPAYSEINNDLLSVRSDGSLALQDSYYSSTNSNNEYIGIGVRPVISLKHDTEFVDGGNGTPTNPYVVKY